MKVGATSKLRLNLLVAAPVISVPDPVILQMLVNMHITKWPKWHTTGTVRMRAVDLADL